MHVLHVNHFFYYIINKFYFILVFYYYFLFNFVCFYYLLFLFVLIVFKFLLLYLKIYIYCIYFFCNLKRYIYEPQLTLTKLTLCIYDKTNHIQVWTKKLANSRVKRQYFSLFLFTFTLHHSFHFPKHGLLPSCFQEVPASEIHNKLWLFCWPSVIWFVNHHARGWGLCRFDHLWCHKPRKNLFVLSTSHLLLALKRKIL